MDNLFARTDELISEILEREEFERAIAAQIIIEKLQAEMPAELREHQHSLAVAWALDRLGARVRSHRSHQRSIFRRRQLVDLVEEAADTEDLGLFSRHYSVNGTDKMLSLLTGEECKLVGDSMGMQANTMLLESAFLHLLADKVAPDATVGDTLEESELTRIYKTIFS